MSDMHGDILRRNARFRAWRAFGVPVEGRWEAVEMKNQPGRWNLWLDLTCGECGANRDGKGRVTVREGRPERPGTTLYATLVEEENLLVYRAIDCPHLSPMLLPTPPGFGDVVELEILAGD